MDETVRRLIVAQLTARAWTDPAFRERLLANPAQEMREAGLEVPQDIEVRAVADTESVRHIILQHRPEWFGDDDFQNMNIVVPSATGFDLPGHKPPNRPKH